MVRGGASLVEREPVFSSDGKRLLVCTACSVSVYSVATGLLVTQLHGHTGRVSGIVVVPAVSLSHAWTSSQDGTIRMWDYGTGSLLRTVNVGLPICSMVIPDLCKPGTAGKTDAKFKGMVAYLSVSWTKEVSVPYAPLRAHTHKHGLTHRHTHAQRAREREML